jgi:hypothetical protein
VRVRRELGRIAFVALGIGLLAVLVHAWNDDLSARSLAARSAALFVIVLLVQGLRLVRERSRRSPAENVVVAWVAYAVAFASFGYLLPLDDVSIGRVALGGVLFATVLAPLEAWELARAERRSREKRDLEDARLDREHEARLARAERTWSPH